MSTCACCKHMYPQNRFLPNPPPRPTTAIMLPAPVAASRPRLVRSDASHSPRATPGCWPASLPMTRSALKALPTMHTALRAAAATTPIGQPVGAIHIIVKTHHPCHCSPQLCGLQSSTLYESSGTTCLEISAAVRLLLGTDDVMTPAPSERASGHRF